MHRPSLRTSEPSAFSERWLPHEPPACLRTRRSGGPAAGRPARAARLEAYHAHEGDPEFRHQHRRWRDRPVRPRDEADELEGVQRAREVRQAVLDADPTVASRLHELEDILGALPDDTQRPDEWRAASERKG